jgi:hypothetical protein
MQDFNKYLKLFCIIYLITIIILIKNSDTYSYTLFVFVPFFVFIMCLVFFLTFITKIQIVKIIYLILAIIFYLFFVFNSEFNVYFWGGAILIPFLCSWIINRFAKKKNIYIEFWGLFFNFSLSILSIWSIWSTRFFEYF